MSSSGLVHIPCSKEFPHRLLKELGDIRNEITDFNVRTTSGVIPCHKVILAINSSVLRGMLRSGLSEITNQEVVLDQYPHPVVESVINYCYTGYYTVANQYIADSIQITDYLHLDELQYQLQIIALDDIRPGNALTWYKLAILMELKDIGKTCKLVMNQSFPDVSSSKEFLGLEFAEMIDVFKECSDVSADHLLQAGLEWVQHDADRRASIVPDVLGHFKLENCSVMYLQEVMLKYDNILTEATVLKTIINALVKLKTSNEGSAVVDKKKSLGVIGGVIGHSPKTNTDILVLKEKEETFATLGEVLKHAQCVFSSICPLQDGFTVSGGEDCDIFVRYFSKTKSWSDLPRLPRKRYHHASVHCDGNIFMVCGFVSTVASASVDYYDVTNNTWHRAPDMLNDVGFPKVCSSLSGLFVLDDAKNFYQMTSALTWMRKTSPPVSSWAVSMASVNDKVYIAGGVDSICACYTPSSDVWSVLTGPKLQHGQGGLVYHNERLYLCAGCAWSENRNEIEEYNIGENTWNICDYQLPEALQFCSAVSMEISE